MRLVPAGQITGYGLGQNAQGAMRAQGVSLPEPYAEFAQATYARMVAGRRAAHAGEGRGGSSLVGR